MIDPRASVLIAGCVLLAGLIVAELYGDSETAAPIAAAPARTGAAPAAGRAPPPRLDDLLTISLARPLFSPSRRPSDTAQGDGGASDLSGNRLTGIITEPDRRLAIFAMAGGKALIVSEGETVSGWRVDAIDPTEITLSGPSGNKILQPKADPNAVRQPRQTARPGQPAGAQAHPGPGPRARPASPAPPGQVPPTPQANAVPPRPAPPAARLNTPANPAAPVRQPYMPGQPR